MALDRTAVKPQSFIPASAAVGLFCVDDLTGSAIYSLPVAAPPQLRGPQPQLRLEYDSNKPGDLPGFGWDLKGIPALVKIGGHYYAEGQMVCPDRQADGSLLWRKSDGGHAVFVPPIAQGGDLWRATRVEDVFGNFIDFDYLADRPSLISYGLAGDKAVRRIEFAYGNDGYLAAITSFLAAKPVRRYEIRREGEFVTEIRLLAHTPEGKCQVLEAPVRFCWANSETAARIGSIKEPCGLETEVKYIKDGAEPGPRNVVQSYTVKSRNLAGVAEYTVSRCFKGGRTHPLLGWVFSTTTEWDEAAQSGRYVVFFSDPKLSHLAQWTGRFAAATAKAAEGNTVPLVHGSGAGPLFHYKISETSCEYLMPEDPARAPLPQQVETVEYGDKGVPLFTRRRRFFYNDQGLAVKIQGDGLTEFPGYHQVRGMVGGREHEVFMPAGRSIFEGNIDLSDEAKLLKRTELCYDFADPSRPLAPTALRQTSWSGAYGGMTRAETVFLDQSGHPKGSVNALGVVTEITCDAYHFPQKVTHTSAGGQVRCEEFETDPATGLPLAARDHRCVASRMVYDAFGGLAEEWGVDLSQPKTWGDRTKLIKVSARSSRRDAASGLILRDLSAGDGGQSGSLRQYVDAFGQVLRSEKRLGKSAWQVELTEYAAPGRISRRSLPYLESDEPSPLWIEMLSDDYGRDIGQVLPDGRRTGKSYHFDPEAGTVEIRSFIWGEDKTRKLVSTESHGRNGMIARRRDTDSGLTRYSRDVLGRVVRETDPCGVETSYRYDALDRCIFEENPIRGTRRYHFGKSGLLVRADVNGQAITYDYDGFGRITRKTVGVDKDGKMPPQVYDIEYLSKPGSGTEHIRETLPGGYQYEIAFAPHGGELERKVDLGNGMSFTLASEFTPDGGLAARIYPDGAKIRNDYSQGGQLRRVFWAGKPPQGWGRLTDPIVEYEGHDCYGRPELTHYHNRVSEIRRYNEFGQTTSLAVGPRAGGKQAYLQQVYDYSADMNGLLTRVEDRSDAGGVQTRVFDYDQFDRLSKSSCSLPGGAGIVDETFSYGKAANVTGFTSPAGVCDFAGANPYQVSARGVLALDQAFDVHGNLAVKKARGKSWRHQFDADNRLLQSTVGENGAEATTRYGHDVDGARFLKVDPDGVCSFYLAPDYQITVYPDGRTLGTIKIQGLGGTVAAVTGVLQNARSLPASAKAGAAPTAPLSGNGRYRPGVVYLHKNSLGSILLATGEAGEKTASLGWTIWGALDESATSGVCAFELQFAGMVYDTSTGLHYAGDRYYDPDSLRFLSPDRARASSDPYSYTSGDPINYVDYNGMMRWWERVVNWWNDPNTAQTGSRFQRVATVVVNAFVTATALSEFYSHDKLTAEGVVPFVLFMGGFAITFQTINFIIYGDHRDSCLAPVWRRICCCRPLCTTHQAIIGLISGTAVSALLFPVSLLTYNGFLENRYDHNATLYANSTFSGAAIGISVPRGMLAGFMAGLPGLALMSPGLPFLAFAQGSVVGSVLMELIMYELAFVAFSGGDILVQVLLTPGQFSAAAQYMLTSKLLIIAPLVASQNPLIAILPISNIPGLTTGPLLLADNTRAPFFPPLCCRPCEEDDSDNEQGGDGVRIEELPDPEIGAGEHGGDV